MARCFRCGEIDAEHYIGYNGETAGYLCHDHYEQFNYDKNEIEHEKDRNLEYIDDDYEKYYYCKFHDNSIGNFSHDCEKCDHVYYSEDEYDNGLCPSCTEDVKYEKRKNHQKKYNAHKEYYRGLINLYRKNGLNTDELSKELYHVDKSYGDFN